MSATDTFAAFRAPAAIPPSGSADLLRLAAILGLFVAAALGLSLGAQVPGSLLGDVPAVADTWHGNASGAAVR